MNLTNKGLGYHYVDDERANNFKVGDVLPVGVALRAYRYWQPGPVLDQGREGACVGFAWTGWRNCTPVRQRTGNYYLDDYALWVYREAQKVDEWPGESYSGTSSQAGAKIMVAQKALETYGWAFNYDEIVGWLKTSGPMVITMPWYESMYETDEKGYIRPNGRLVGGHAMLCYGVNKVGDLRVQNSWGPDFGEDGRGWISKNDWLWLTSQPRGWSACTALELSQTVRLARAR